MNAENGAAGGPEAYGLSPSDCLQGRQVRLRTVQTSDYQFIRDLESGHPSSFIRFRHRGVSVSPEAWVQTLWQGVLSQFLIIGNHDQRPLGLVTAYGADFRSGRCHEAIIASVNSTTARPALMEAVRIHIDYLFAVFPIRKITAEVIDFNWHSFSSGEGKVFSKEGVLRKHEYHDGRYWDVHLLAVFRDDWMSYYRQPGMVRSGLGNPNDPLPHSFQQFSRRLADEFDWPHHLLVETSRLREDLCCDSIAYLELLTILESVSPNDINDEVIANVETLGQLFQLYLAFTEDGHGELG